MADRSRWSDAAYVIAARGASREVLPVRGGAENSPMVYRVLRDYEGAVEAREVGVEIQRGGPRPGLRSGADLRKEVALRDDGWSDFGALMAKRSGLMR